MNTVLVVDDKEMLRDSVGTTLQRAGLDVVMADGAAAAVSAVAKRRPDAVITDLKMPGGSGIDLLKQLREFDDDLPVVLMTAFGTVQTAVEALKLGAFDYITKPFEGDELVIAVKRAIEHGRLLKENAVLRSGGSGIGATGGNGSGGPLGLARLVGDSPVMRRVKEQALAVAESQGNVLICGESGTGKEVVARAIHELSPRARGPFLGVNCAALSESLLESELFGHERGSFTGAERQRKGRFELADCGTLLLDEISEVPTRVQAKLLRVLQERTFERVGSSTSVSVDVRVVATSNLDLPRAVARGEFRQDLFFRLNVLPIHVPPLRDRAEDVPALTDYFVGLLARREGKGAMRFSDGAMSVMMEYGWPGNVRELQNVCERAVVLTKGGVVEAEMISPWLLGGTMGGGGMGEVPMAMPRTAGMNGHHGAVASVEVKTAGFGAAASGGGGNGSVVVMDRLLEDIERDAIVRTLQRFSGHRQKTAQALGIGVRTLGLKLKKWKSLLLVEQTL
ncbi:MAG: sigma-54-dependent transcriptional regulator [Phycisphaerales bacterium]